MNCCNFNLISQGNDPDFCLACHTSQHYPSKKGFWVWRLATLLKHFFMFFHYRINNLSSKKQAYSKAYPSISKHYPLIAEISSHTQHCLFSRWLAPNKMQGHFWQLFLIHFFMLFHMVPSVLLSMAALLTIFWLVAILQQPIRFFEISGY